MSTPTTSTGASAARARKTASPASASKVPGATGADGNVGRRMDLPAAMNTLSEGDVLTPEGLYQFLEALRIISTGTAFFTESAATQLERAVKRGARESKDGRLTMEQKLKLKLVLRRVSRGLADAHSDLFAVARDAMKAYTPMEEFLEELASEHTSRPHRRSRAGFDPFGGN